MNKRFLPFLWALLIPLQSPAQDVGELSRTSLQVQEIRCSGNTQTSCDFIRDKLYLHAGQDLDEEEIRNAELRLAALRNFKAVHIRLEKGAERGAVIVVIEVREADPIAKDFLFGASERFDSSYSMLGARVAHQNVFGNGKYAELRATTIVPLQDDPNTEGGNVFLRYADPQLFGSRSWFAQAHAGWMKTDNEDRYGNFRHIETPELHVSVGRRFADFSYVTLGVSYKPGAEYVYGFWNGVGIFEFHDISESFEKSADLIYGWSSEDDLYFPTRGSTFQFGAGADFGADSPDLRLQLQFRKTWQGTGGYWSFAFGGDPRPEYRDSLNDSQLIALNYARPFVAGDLVQRGRWYLEPGLNIGGRTPGGETFYGIGLKAGMRAQTRAFGVVNLYLMASVDTHW